MSTQDEEKLVKLLGFTEKVRDDDVIYKLGDSDVWLNGAQWDELTYRITKLSNMARVDELDKKLPDVVGYEILFANPEIMKRVTRRISELEGL